MTKPSISIYIPVYNRADLVYRSIDSVLKQTFTDWELIIIDDGSTDGSQEAIERLTRDVSQPVRYIKQENRGLFYCRSIAPKLADGKYIAPLDSDDAWVPTHLEDLFEILENDDGIDWAYGDLRRIDIESGKVLMKSKFHHRGRPARFMELNCRQSGGANVFYDSMTLSCAIESGLECSQQTSLIRKSLFDDVQFIGTFRICEDQQFSVRAVAAGKRLAYVDSVHLDYLVHDQNISCVNVSKDSDVACDKKEFEKSVLVRSELIELFERLWSDIKGDRVAEQALHNRLAREYFWNLGYGTYWRNGQVGNAVRCLIRGVVHRPTNLRYWKTLVAVLVKSPFMLFRKSQS